MSDKLTQRIRFRRLLRLLENAIVEREGRTSTSWSIQQAMRHEVDMERVRPARDKLDEFVESLISGTSPALGAGSGQRSVNERVCSVVGELILKEASDTL